MKKKRPNESFHVINIKFLNACYRLSEFDGSGISCGQIKTKQFWKYYSKNNGYATQSIDLSFVSGKIAFLDVLIPHRLAGLG